MNTAISRVKDLTRVDSDDVVYGNGNDVGSEIDLFDCSYASE